MSKTRNPGEKRTTFALLDSKAVTQITDVQIIRFLEHILKKTTTLANEILCSDYNEELSGKTLLCVDYNRTKKRKTGTSEAHWKRVNQVRNNKKSIQPNNNNNNNKCTI